MLYNESKVCARVKEWREKCGHSQEQVARCIGTTRQTLSEFEQGNPDKLRLGQLLILCRPNVELDGETIPMMDCELGYLLGEEGYENRTRAKTDICKATGLSEVAVSALESRKEITVDITLFKNAGYSDEKISAILDAQVSIAKQKRTLLLEVIEKLLTSVQSERIIDKLVNAFDAKEIYDRAMKLIESYNSPDFVFEKQRVSFMEAFDVVEKDGMCILPSNEAEEYFINEASLTFREMLKEMLHKERE